MDLPIPSILTSPEEPIYWNLLSLDHVVDGDTIKLSRWRSELIDQQLEQIIVDRKPISIRLLWVDTPERGDHPGYENAKRDLSTWIQDALDRGPVQLVTYESGGWDRVLGDVIAADGESVSQYMLMHANSGQGWPPYKKGK